MQLSQFILVLCLIGAIQCARLKREDEESSTAPEEEKVTEAPSKTDTTDKSPFPEAVGAWFGQTFGSSGDVDWVKQAQSIFSNVPWYPKSKK